jgi:outer membrane receptor protein involved in Fe transport
MKSINIGYNFKKSFMKDKMPYVKQLRIYVAATNLFTITPYKGMDPEVGYGQYTDSNGIVQDNYASGIDLGTYPLPRTYFVGLDVKF